EFRRVHSRSRWSPRRTAHNRTSWSHSPDVPPAPWLRSASAIGHSIPAVSAFLRSRTHTDCDDDKTAEQGGITGEGRHHPARGRGPTGTHRGHPYHPVGHTARSPGGVFTQEGV